jgi:hypothetical protein
MVPVAASGGVIIYCPSDGRYAFYNSPYPAHRLMTGVDIYPDTTHDLSTPSPVNGKVMQIRRVKAPAGHGFTAPDHDVVTVIRSAEDPDKVVKILHVDTALDVGMMVDLGQDLGLLIRSGYFGYQTPLHAHVEVRSPSDPLRVRGGYSIDSLLDLEGLEVATDLRGIIIAARRGYALVRLALDTVGVVVDVDGVPGVLDGGIPLYGWFGVHAKGAEVGASVKLLNKTIGRVTGSRPGTCVADCLDFKARIGVTNVDLFFMLLPSETPTVAVISETRGELDAILGSETRIELV